VIPKECEQYVVIAGMNDCWLWAGGTSRNKKHRRPYFRNEPAYRYIYKRCVGNLSQSQLLCHKCDNPMCVNPRHLFVGTQRDNMQDAIAKRRPVGRPRKDHPLAAKMKQMAARGATQYAIAKRLGVDHSTVRWHLSKET
jgi:hypothetical protein